MKVFMKGTSCLLSVLLVLSLIMVAFSSIAVHAESFSDVPDFSDFDMDCYVANLFTAEGNSLNNAIEIELNSESTNKIIKNSIESNSLLMGTMTAWQVATFEASDVTSDSVTELGYYESIILSSINTAMKSSRVKDFFDNAVIKDGKMLFSSFKDILKSEYFITDFSIDTYKSLSAEDQSAYIKSFGEAFKKQYPKLDKTSDALKIFSTVVKTAKSFEECMNNYAAYAFCSLTNKHLTKVINDLYEQCPTEKVTLKAALLNISSACTSVELDLGADALDAIYRGADIIFGVLTDGWVTKIISAHPAGLALMIGRAVGKTVSNILFSTDAICENYYKMCCFDEFEKLVRFVTRYEMNTYAQNKTNDNANNMFWAIRLMFNINEVSCDLSIDYAKTIYEKSVAGIFLDKTEYENYKKSIEYIREGKQREYGSLMTSYIFYLEVDYPEIYAAYMKLIDEIENPVVHATGISFTKKHMTLGLEDDTFYFWNNAEVSPANASNRSVHYTSSDESIVSIKSGNTLMIELHNKVGSVVIIATAEDGGLTDELTIDVVEGHGKDGIHLEDPVTNIQASGKCGENAYWNLYNNEVLKIVGTGPMDNYDEWASVPWSYYRFSIKHAIVSSGITNIGSRAFVDCSSLKSISIGDTVLTIGSYSFSDCISIKTIIIPDSVQAIADYAFCGYGGFDSCTGLEYVYLGKSVESIGDNAFNGCEALSSVDFPNSIISIGRGAFAHTGLTTAIIPDSVNFIGSGAFSFCPYLSSASISNSVTYIASETFYHSGLTKIYIPESIKSISSDAFKECINLRSVIVPDSVTFIGSSAFKGCTNLADVMLGASVETIEARAFEDCTNLGSIDIPESVTKIGTGAFFSCSNLTSIAVNENNAVYDSRNNCNAIIGSKANNLLFGCKNTVIPETVTRINWGAFQACNGITRIVIPNSVREIENYAFVNCKEMNSIIVSSNTTKIGLRSIGYYYDSTIKNYKLINNYTIYGYKNSQSEQYANQNSINFIAIDDIVTQTYIDESTGISVSSDSGLTLHVTKLDFSGIVPNREMAYMSYELKLLKNDVVANPIRKTNVRIPCDFENAKVYFWDNDNLLTNIKAVYNNGCLEFETNRLYQYLVTVPMNVIVGDTNLDGHITISDVTAIQRHLAEMHIFTDEQLALADTNGDGEINITDATHLQMYLAEYGVVLGKQPAA